MNMRASVQQFEGAPRAEIAARRLKYHPRSEILDEVIAGFLWMDLRVPQDVSLPELEMVARQLVARIRSNANEAAIENEITALRQAGLHGAVDAAAIRRLAQRSIAAVKGS